MLDARVQHPVFSIVFAIVMFIFWAVASVPCRGEAHLVPTILLKFEDRSTNIESLADNPDILLPLHATALRTAELLALGNLEKKITNDTNERMAQMDGQETTEVMDILALGDPRSDYHKIDFRWDPAREQMVLSRDDTEVKVVLGNRHALINESKLRPLSKPPIILRGAVALPPQDIVSLLQDLLPSMDVSWDEAKATIEVKKRLTQVAPVVNSNSGRFELKTIIIDPGHGGHDPGAVRSGVREEQIVLDIALRLAKLIESESTWDSVVTRDSDEFITLGHRTEIANQYPADSTLFISIHCNSSRTSGRGVETFVFDLKATDAEAAALARRENADEEMDLIYILSHCYHVGTEPYSLEAAKMVQTSLVKRLKLRDRTVKRAPFYVLAGTKMPAVLVELGFLSNYYDRTKLKSEKFRQSAAEALFGAIKDFDKAVGKLLVKADQGA